MSKNFISLLLAVCMLICLSACGASDATGTNPPSQTGANKTDAIAPSQSEPNNDSTVEKPDPQEEKYNRALSLVNEGNYAEAYDLFYSIRGYEDSEDYLSRFRFCYDKVEELDSDGDPFRTYEYTYNIEGNLTKEEMTDVWGNTYTTEYAYDSQGNLIKELRPHEPNQTRTYDYTYDSQGNLIKEVEKYPDLHGSKGETYTTEYTYDSEGNLIKQVRKDSDGDTSTTDYTYDSQGNKIQEVLKDYLGYTSTTEYTYDSNGRLINKKAPFYTNQYSYDSDGNLIKEVRKSGGNTVHTDEYTYDNKGNKIKWVDKGAVTSTYDYTYYGEHVFYTP